MRFGQTEHALRCEWGREGLAAVAEGADVLVIVDVLSFSTAVDIALSRGASILPCPWKDDRAAAFAADQGAILAASRGSGDRYSLSPSSLQSIPVGTRIVLPSPNGSALSILAPALPVYTACLRNAPAVAKRAAARGRRIGVVPAGERWSDFSLRPCLEDWIGAGAVLAALPGTRSPEAEAAVSVFERFRHDLAGALRRCDSGKELAQRGFAEDVELAAEHATSEAAPILRDGAFVDDRG